MRKDSEGKGGVIVNISSIAGLQAVSQLPVYSATKHAVVSFSRSFAVSIYMTKSIINKSSITKKLKNKEKKR